MLSKVLKIIETLWHVKIISVMCTVILGYLGWIVLCLDYSTKFSTQWREVIPAWSYHPKPSKLTNLTAESNSMEMEFWLFTLMHNRCQQKPPSKCGELDRNLSRPLFVHITSVGRAYKFLTLLNLIYLILPPYASL